jgi:hypothetical protein
MLNRLDWAEMVLLVCTETYYRRFRGQDEPDKGKGADWEGQLITLDLYDAKSRTVDFVPILFSDRCKQFIPEPLRGVTHYLLDPGDDRSATDYSRLLAFFHGNAGVAPTPLGLPKEVTSRRARPMVFITHEKAIGTQQQPTLPRRNQRGAGRNPPPHGPGPLFYAIVSLVAFLFGFAILSVMLWNAQLLVSLGLTGNFYYVLLLVLGLSSAAFLFGLLQSHAVYRGHTGWGHLELGGAIVGCALVVVGGFYLVPNPLPFAVTVFVHERAGSMTWSRKSPAKWLWSLAPRSGGRTLGQMGPCTLPTSHLTTGAKRCRCGWSPNSLSQSTRTRNTRSKVTPFNWRCGKNLVAFLARALKTQGIKLLPSLPLVHAGHHRRSHAEGFMNAHKIILGNRAAKSRIKETPQC